MDMLTLAMAKKYTDSQRLAYTETSEGSIKWDGNTEGLQVFDGAMVESEGLFYRVTDKILTPEMVRRIDVRCPDTCIVDIISKDDLDGAVLYRGKFAVGTMFYNRLLVISIKSDLSPELPAGTYFLKDRYWDTDVFVESVFGKMTETIHPIDPKFLPGVCLPVVELTTAPTGEPLQALSAEESSALTSCIGMPIIIKLNFGGEGGAYVFTYAISGGTHHFTDYFTGLAFASSDGANWAYSG